MCIIVWKPGQVKLFPKTIEACFLNNPDGAGFSYVEDGKLVTQRGFFTLESFNEAYLPHELKPTLLHFRIRTHGEYSEANCHPFVVTENLVFAHNGVIAKMPHDTTKSDTLMFSELVVQPLVAKYGEGVVFDPLIMKLMEAFIGYSKLVFLTNKGEVAIANAKDGTWNSKCWFSNDSWKKINKKYKYDDYGYEDTWPHNQGKHVVYPPKGRDSAYLRALQAPKSTLRTPQDDTDAYEAWQKKRNPPMLPVVIEGNTSHRPLQINDYLRVIEPIKGCERGWLGKAMGFYEDGTIEMFFPIHKRTVRLSVLHLDRVTPNVIAPESPLSPNQP